MKKGSTLVIIFFFFASAFGQQLPIPRNIKNTYDKGTRSTDGKPGSNYWQNTAAYDISINFDPISRLVEGSEEIVFKNNSTATLNEILFKLYPNLYKKGAATTKEISSEDASEGMEIKEIIVDGKLQPVSSYQIDGTNMSLAAQLAPGKIMTFKISFSYILNKGSHNRTGLVDSGAYFIAYFFPRITVYDDIDGWNRYPYIGSYEFYNDFCDFKLSVKLPDGYVMWGTGDHVNRDEIFNENILDRIRKAEKNDGYVNIIEPNDLNGKNSVTKGSLYNVWKFEAKNISDIAFAVSNHYVWQSTSLIVDSLSKRRTRVDAVFNTAHDDYYHVVSDARKTIEAMSFRFPKWPFPYNHETVFDGLDQMEYPMMANDNPVKDRSESIELSDHEIFHTLFPFYMGINETKYGWMDEGWATIGEWLISPMIDSSIVDEYGMLRYEKTAGSEADGVIMDLTTNLTGDAFFLNSYPKPALGYLFVKDMLGEDLFYKALHYYMSNWGGKHPMPLDFFNCMNTGSGKNMNWFWKKWFYDTGFPDLAIADVQADVKQKKIVINSIGSKPVPIDLTVTFENGSIQKIHKTIAVWEDGTKEVVISFSSEQKIRSVLLGSTYTPDIDKTNNYFERR